MPAKAKTLAAKPPAIEPPHPPQPCSTLFPEELEVLVFGVEEVGVEEDSAAFSSTWMVIVATSE